MSGLFSPNMLWPGVQSGGGFSPASLSPAIWYDPSDISTLFQDAAGLTPVTASGQSVGKMLDKSGNGFHATQVTLGARPIYTVASGLSFLSFDGADDVLNFAPSTALMQDFSYYAAGICRHAPAGGGSELRLLPDGGNEFAITDNDVNFGAGGYRFYLNGNRFWENTNTQNVARVTVVTIAAALATLRANKVDINSTAGWTPGAGSPSGFISQNVARDFHGALFFPGTLSAPNRASIETWMGSKVGIAL